MTDFATPNLPAIDMVATSAFYQKLGFVEDYVSPGWMILSRGGLQSEFFPYPDLDPATSSFGSCLRVDDLPGLYQACVAAGISQTAVGMPRVHPPQKEASGLTISYMIDPNGSLIRMIQND